MDTQTLDRLLMDRALGALPPDTDALLTACLDQDNAAAARAREFDAAATAARRLFQRPAPTGLPPFPALRIHKVKQVRQRLQVVRHAASLAAALVVGLGLGIGFSSGRAPRATEPTATISYEPRWALAAAPGRAQRNFWSTQRLYNDAREARRSDSVRLIWDSAVSLPKRGGES
jgi:anti-sigma factor RsiW